MLVVCELRRRTKKGGKGTQALIVTVNCLFLLRLNFLADFRGWLLFHSFCTVDVILYNFLLGRAQLNIWFLLPSNLLVWLVPQTERKKERERQRSSLKQVDECLIST